MRLSRRQLLAALPLSAATRPPRILLRSSWQSVNIGDIGHTPGALTLLNKFFPEAEITLWPGNLGHGSRELLTKGYPRLRIAEGTPVHRGQLLMSAGDGTAKPQGDSYVQDKTIAKVTSTNVSCTYEDGSYCVPCVLMAC